MCLADLYPAGERILLADAADGLLSLDFILTAGRVPFGGFVCTLFFSIEPGCHAFLYALCRARVKGLSGRIPAKPGAEFFPDAVFSGRRGIRTLAEAFGLGHTRAGEEDESQRQQKAWFGF
ncbi:MAG: hypothetical protein J4F42_06255 [Desulfurellaceae bacterium]|nr:hypothetical protein [Desulfurellaceae bacterium]